MNTSCLPPEHHPQHGGSLTYYAKHYGIEQSNWLDLSTGINPNGYTHFQIHNALYQQLPDEQDGLTEVAAAYYKCSSLLMVPGSSWAIQTLPLILNKKNDRALKVLLPKMGYQEHARAWRQHGAHLQFYDDTPSQALLVNCDICVLINPNNPTGQLTKKTQVIEMAETLNNHNGYLIVDEAFMDMHPHESVLPDLANNIIVLRSLGKFFGLAGIRVGSVFAHARLLCELNEHLPCWAVSHVARHITKCALQDTAWIEQSRLAINSSVLKLQRFIQQKLKSEIEDKTVIILSSDLFITLIFSESSHAKNSHHILCQQGIYTRLLDDRAGIRLGLPVNSYANWQKIDQGLSAVANNMKQGIFHNAI
ncbi:threonine-phosphate decarboxylase CobD [Oceaniserpentilla sp. 4NH20-0058]|uniref:threonine-phosphate decarboxylase n=1 Tax=Oceaniserpentilla sp. 4NH20-0058 TaxID=3127660 RepID=UPI00310A9594